MPDPGPALAHIVASYFNTLVEQKLERKEALELTAQYQAELLDPERSEGEGVG